MTSKAITPSARNALLRRTKVVKVALPVGTSAGGGTPESSGRSQSYTAAFAPPSSVALRAAGGGKTPDSGVRSQQHRPVNTGDNTSVAGNTAESSDVSSGSQVPTASPQLTSDPVDPIN